MNRKAAFVAELAALLEKHGAMIEAEDCGAIEIHVQGLFVLVPKAVANAAEYAAFADQLSDESRGA